MCAYVPEQQSPPNGNAVRYEWQFSLSIFHPPSVGTLLSSCTAVPSTCKFHLLLTTLVSDIL